MESVFERVSIAALCPVWGLGYIAVRIAERDTADVRLWADGPRLAELPRWGQWTAACDAEHSEHTCKKRHWVKWQRLPLKLRHISCAPAS